MGESPKSKVSKEGLRNEVYSMMNQSQPPSNIALRSQNSHSHALLLL